MHFEIFILTFDFFRTMRRIRYSRWSNSSAESLGADSVFNQLNDYMSDTGDLQQAMRRLMQRGLKQEEKQVAGLDDLLSQITREMRRLFEQYQIQSAMDQVGQKLQSRISTRRCSVASGSSRSTLMLRPSRCMCGSTARTVPETCTRPPVKDDGSRSASTG